MTLKTLLCDLGNVLLFFSHKQMFEQLEALTGANHTALFQREKLLYLYETGRIATPALYELLGKHSPKAFTYGDFLHAYTDIFTPNTALFLPIETLKAKGVRLVLLSNVSDIHFQKAKQVVPLLRLFDAFALSYEVGAVKPERALFERALQLAECSVKECLYIDDILDYIRAARRLGIPSHHYRNLFSLQKRLSLQALSDR